MEYVILGAGAAGITAARIIRKADSQGNITMLSTDTQVHSRCMLHKFLSHERTAEGLNFAETDFFEKNRIHWKPGVTVTKLDTAAKKVMTDKGEEISYDKLLIATGAESFIPPVGNLREANNVFGLRHLKDAQAIDAMAKKAENIAIIGSGLVGLDAAYGLMETGKKVSVIEMAEQILPIQLDKTGAYEYQKRFEKAGAAFYLGRKAADTIMNAEGKITRLVLDNGTEIPCDLVIVAAGVANRILGFVNAPTLLQKVVAKCIREKTDLTYYNRNRETLYEGLRQCGFSCIKPQGAFYLFVKSPIEDEKAFCEAAKGYNILLVPGSSFGCPGYVRIAYCVAYETIIGALPRFQELAKQYFQR